MASADRSMLTRFLVFLEILALAVTTSSFSLEHVGSNGVGQRQSPFTATRNQPSLLVRLQMAGFGDATSAGTTSKLKAKSQWDRYLAMKQSPAYTVGVKVVAPSSSEQQDNSSNEKWLIVGKIRCQDETKIELATARQRALLAEHAKRLFPIEVSPQAKLSWGYQNDDDEKWIIVDPKAADAVADNAFDKTIGFQGTPDPSTGFYCVYNEGRLVDSSGTIDRPSSKKRTDQLPNAKKTPRVASKKLGS